MQNYFVETNLPIITNDDKIEFQIEKEHHINISFSYMHIYSAFDITLNLLEKED